MCCSKRYRSAPTTSPSFPPTSLDLSVENKTDALSQARSLAQFVLRAHTVGNVQQTGDCASAPGFRSANTAATQQSQFAFASIAVINNTDYNDDSMAALCLHAGVPTPATQCQPPQPSAAPTLLQRRLQAPLLSLHGFRASPSASCRSLATTICQAARLQPFQDPVTVDENHPVPPEQKDKRFKEPSVPELPSVSVARVALCMTAAMWRPHQNGLLLC